MPKTIFEGAYAQFVEVLVAARTRSGLTQTEVAAKVGKDQSFISLVENSQRRVDILEFVALSRAMGEDPERLFAQIISALPENFNI
jgi:transcriptional regulator with XRE-family HTH domain